MEKLFVPTMLQQHVGLLYLTTIFCSLTLISLKNYGHKKKKLQIVDDENYCATRRDAVSTQTKYGGYLIRRECGLAFCFSGSSA
jgi:hypothetical protein